MKTKLIGARFICRYKYECIFGVDINKSGSSTIQRNHIEQNFAEQTIAWMQQFNKTI